MNAVPGAEIVKRPATPRQDGWETREGLVEAGMDTFGGQRVRGLDTGHLGPCSCPQDRPSSSCPAVRNMAPGAVFVSQGRIPSSFSSFLFFWCGYNLLSLSGNSGRKSSATQSYKCMLGLSVSPQSHQTLTWTTSSLTCVRGHFYACVYTRGLGTQTASQHNILTRKNSPCFLVHLTGFGPRVSGSRARCPPYSGVVFLTAG